MATLLGASVAGYTIESVAGRGGMGVVYRARDPELDRTVALKVIAPELAADPGFRARFVREARVTAQLDHPNVIPVFDAGEDEGRLYIAMRWVEGTDLGALIAERGALEPRKAAELIAQAASALDAAHARGLVHRDVKPGNLLLPAGSRSHVYLTDFGLAKRDGTSGALTTTGNWLGTPDYAAPEQIDGRELDARADVYALGCVLFTALTGRPPFADVPRLRKGWAQVHEPPPLGDVPAPLRPVLGRALAKQPVDRYATAGELGDAASDAVAGRARPARTGVTARLVRRRPRRGALIAAAVAVLLALAAGAAALLGAFSGDDPQPAPKAPRAAPPAPPSPTAGTIRCSATSCIQSGHRVQAPIEDGRCGAGRWTRIDAGAPPLIACVPDATLAVPPAAVPDIAGARLDRAESYLDRLGLGHDTSGGGAFGPIVRDNWVVCATSPPARGAIASGDQVKLFIDRRC